MEKLRYKRKIEKQKNSSMYGMVIRGYLLLILMVVAIVCGTVVITFYRVDHSDWESNRYQVLKSQENLMKKGRYQDLSIKKILGKSGYYEVIDKQRNVIYTSRRDTVNSYTANSLRFMPEINGTTEYYMEELDQDDDDEIKYVLTRYKIKEDQDNQLVMTGIALIDEERYILYSTMDMGEQLTKKEMKMIFSEGYDMSYPQKYKFKDRKGETCYLILHFDVASMKDADPYNFVWLSTVIPGFALIILVLVFFALLMTGKIKKPLEYLNSQIGFLGQKTDRAGKEHTQKMPKEFAAVLDTLADTKQKLQDSEEKRRKMEQERQKMLADISHDLKTPVTVIKGYVHAIQDGMIPEDKVKQYLQTIDYKSIQLEELINSFHEFSRLEHPEFQLEKQEGDFCEFVREYLAEKYEELDMQGFELDIDLPEQQVRMSFDAFQMKRVFENIINNSVKHNDTGTRIMVRLRRRKQQVVVYIGDNGKGIPPELAERIFEPFAIGDASRSGGKGSGLGMAIAQKVVEAHGGSIRLMRGGECTVATEYEIILPMLHS